jgi:hypothetical protein
MPSPESLPKSRNNSPKLFSSLKELSSETLDGNESVKSDVLDLPSECDCVESFHTSKSHSLLDVSFPTSVKEMWEVWHQVMPDFVINKQGASDLESNYESTSIEKGTVISTSYKLALGLYNPVTRIESSVEKFDEGNVCMISVSRTPDVPYGTCFETVVRVCFMKSDGGCRVVASYTLEFLSDVNWLVKGMRRV